MGQTEVVVSPPHELPEQREGEGSVPFVQVLTRDADQREFGLLLSQLHCVVTVFQLEQTEQRFILKTSLVHRV